MKNLIIVRGGGDLATGSIYKLKKSGFPVLILETANPSAIRRNKGCPGKPLRLSAPGQMWCWWKPTVRSGFR